MNTFPLQFFDRSQEWLVTERRLPHWSQAGALCFITWRTWDSLPRAVMDAWLEQRNAWLERHGIDPRTENWRQLLLRLALEQQLAFRNQISERWEANLDACYGACELRRPECAKIVADCLRHFDGERYRLADFVVMPNHVHVLAAFPNEEAMLKQCDSWKHFTAVQLNKSLSKKGRFWQVDGFDHLVRGPEQFLYLREYVADNPRRASLTPGEYLHYSRAM